MPSGPNKNCYPAAPQLIPFYRDQMFPLFGNTSGKPTQVLGCPLGAAADGCANRQSVSHTSDDHEQVQTVRVDDNLNQKDTAWFRFQVDYGVQAAYTDPINSLFDAVSPQPLYSFAAGYTHVFSQNLVNYFNPAFSWYESLFGPSNFQKTLAAFPIVLQGTGANAFTPIGGLDSTWVQGRRASRFFINDNLAWSFLLVTRAGLTVGLSEIGCSAEASSALRAKSVLNSGATFSNGRPSPAITRTVSSLLSAANL